MDSSIAHTATEVPATPWTARKLPHPRVENELRRPPTTKEAPPNAPPQPSNVPWRIEYRRPAYATLEIADLSRNEMPAPSLKLRLGTRT